MQSNVVYFKFAELAFLAVICSQLLFPQIEPPGGHHGVEALPVHVFHLHGVHNLAILAHEIHDGVFACGNKEIQRRTKNVEKFILCIH